MSIDQKIQNILIPAMKAGEKEKVLALRTFRAHLKNERIKKGQELDESEELAVLASISKKLKESIEMYKQGNRIDLVVKESYQLDLIESFMPKGLSDEELNLLIKENITTVGASSIKDMGKVMSAIMPTIKGRADGKIVQEKVKEALANLS